MNTTRSNWLLITDYFFRSGQRVHQIPRGLEMLDQHLPLRAALHADLGDVEIRRLVRGEENVVMRGIATVLEEIGREVAAQMVHDNELTARNVHLTEMLLQAGRDAEARLAALPQAKRRK